MDGIVLKHGDLFLFADDAGDLPGGSCGSLPGRVSDRPGDGAEQGYGLYYRDTRHLSDYHLALAGEPLAFVAETGSTGVALRLRQSAPGPLAGSVAVQRERLVEAALQERVLLTNLGGERLALSLELQLGADFADIFQVRGTIPDRRGRLLEPVVADLRPGLATGGVSVTFGYRGLDGVERCTAVAVVPTSAGVTAAPEDVIAHVSEELASAIIPVRIELAPHGSAAFETVVSVDRAKALAGQDFDAAARRLEAEYAGWTAPSGTDSLWRRVLDQSFRDLHLLTTDLGHGPVITAGVPWFATLFGRDSIIAALQLLPYHPEVAVGTLRTLAAYQGTRQDPSRDETPGKILHEMRRGEMANLGQVVFGRYYGSADSTPLFLVLLAETCRRTGNLALCRELLPAAEAALDWCERYGDLDGDGYLEYHRETPHGLANQGWKDSGDSISHRSGELALSPIALCEVQGYYYAGLLGMAEVLRRLGDGEKADALAGRAADLKARFNRDFWMEDQGYVALGLDRDKAQIGVVASNAGHCLWTGILTEEHAAAVARRLLQPDMFSGWGLRTLSSQERRYDPDSYHNGSVWPHDTVIAVLGLARYGFKAEAHRLGTALLEAAQWFSNGRLPELFGGQPRLSGAGPRPYPQACSPQAWAAGAPLMLWPIIPWTSRSSARRRSPPCPTAGGVRRSGRRQPGLRYRQRLQPQGLDSGPPR